MDCFKCSVRDICKIFEFTKEAGVFATISITNCRIKPDNIMNAVQASAPAVSNHLTVPGIKKDFKDISNQARQTAKEQAINVKPKIQTEKIKVIPKEESIPVTCPSCGGNTTIDDLTICAHDGCGKDICSCCGTEAMGTGKKYCEEHWATN